MGGCKPGTETPRKPSFQEPVMQCLYQEARRNQCLARWWAVSNAVRNRVNYVSSKPAKMLSVFAICCQLGEKAGLLKRHVPAATYH